MNLPSEPSKEELLEFAKRYSLEYEPPPLDWPRNKDIFNHLPDVPVTYSVRQKIWTLLEEYSYDYLNCQLVAPAWYKFDLSSIPRMFWGVLAPNELSILAPLFHDILYDFKGNPPIGYIIPYRKFSRKESDDLFLHLMEIEGVPHKRRWIAYHAVRLFNKEW